MTIDAGNGADTVGGGNGVDVILGRDGDDFVDGQQGNDAVFAGTGDDVMQWDPGDGSDTLEGEGDRDRLAFNGSAIGENVELSANGERLLLTRNIGSIVMDVDEVEAVDYRALGGADVFTVNDLTGTAVTDVGTDLAGTFGGNTGDGQVDTVSATATEGDDHIVVGGSASVGVTAEGMAAELRVRHPEPSDQLQISTLGGNDTSDTSGLAPSSIALTID